MMIFVYLDLAAFGYIEFYGSIKKNYTLNFSFHFSQEVDKLLFVVLRSSQL